MVTRPKKPRAARTVETSFDSKAEWVLRAVRRAEQFAEFLAGRLGELRCDLPAGEVPPVAFLEVPHRPEQFRLQLFGGRSVVQGGTALELPAGGHAADLRL